jgi:hypothetical protein
MMAHVYNSSYSRSRGRKISSSRPARVKFARPYLKSKEENKRVLDMTEMLEYFPSMYKAKVSLHHHHQKKKKKERKLQAKGTVI